MAAIENKFMLLRAGNTEFHSGAVPQLFKRVFLQPR